MDHLTHSLLHLAMHSHRNTDAEIEHGIANFADKTGLPVDRDLIGHFCRGRTHARGRRALNSETTGDGHGAYILGYITKPEVPGFEPPQAGPLTMRHRLRSGGNWRR
jgi:hypothetical protein